MLQLYHNVSNRNVLHLNFAKESLKPYMTIFNIEGGIYKTTYEFVNCKNLHLNLRRKIDLNKMPFIKLLNVSDLLNCNLFGGSKLNKNNEKCLNISTRI